MKIDFINNNSVIGNTIFICYTEYNQNLFMINKNFYLGTFKLNSNYKMNIEIPYCKILFIFN